MANIIIPLRKKWIIKPPVGSQINFGHPLSRGLVGCWLLNERGGKSQNLITRNKATTQNAVWVPNGLDCSGILSTQDGAEFNEAKIGNNDYTVIVCANPISEGAGRVLFSQKNDALGAPYTQMWFAVNQNKDGTSTQNRIAINEYSNAGRGTDFIYTCDGNFHTFVATRTIAGVRKLYIDGRLIAQNADAAGAVAIYVSGQLTALGSMAGTYNGLQFNRTIKFAYSYNNRVLSPSEIQKLYQEPYCFIAPRRSRFIISTGAAPSGDVTINASVLSAKALINSPTVTGEAVISASVLSVAVQLLNPAVTGGVDVTITPDTISATIKMQSPTITGNALIQANIIEGHAILQSATIIATEDITITPQMIQAVLDLLTPVVSVGTPSGIVDIALLLSRLPTLEKLPNLIENEIKKLSLISKLTKSKSRINTMIYEKSKING